jgi:hypothetical protein
LSRVKDNVNEILLLLSNLQRPFIISSRNAIKKLPIEIVQITPHFDARKYISRLQQDILGFLVLTPEQGHVGILDVDRGNILDETNMIHFFHLFYRRIRNLGRVQVTCLDRHRRQARPHQRTLRA